MKSIAHAATVQAVRPIQAPTAPRFDSERMAAALNSVYDSASNAGAVKDRIISALTVSMYALEASAVIDQALAHRQTAFAAADTGQLVHDSVMAVRSLDKAALADLIAVTLDDVLEAFSYAAAAESAAEAAIRANTATVAGF